VGDWELKEDGSISIKVSDTGHEIDALLIAIHELVEVVLCIRHGITQAAVDDFDMSFVGDGEPGEAADAPYRKQHTAADIVERLVALEAGVNWLRYNNRVDALHKENADEISDGI
jgi:hypothetical protein